MYGNHELHNLHLNCWKFNIIIQRAQSSQITLAIGEAHNQLQFIKFFVKVPFVKVVCYTVHI